MGETGQVKNLTVITGDLSIRVSEHMEDKTSPGYAVHVDEGLGWECERSHVGKRLHNAAVTEQSHLPSRFHHLT